MGHEKKQKPGAGGGVAVVKKLNGSSLRSIFMHADGVDMWLMTLGFIGAVGDGFSTPLVLLVTSKLMNNLGGASAFTVETFIHNINKVSHSSLAFCILFFIFSVTHMQRTNYLWFWQNSVALLYLACGSWVACFLGRF